MAEIDQIERVIEGLKELVREMKGLPFPYSPLSNSDEIMAVMIGAFIAFMVLMSGVFIAAVMH